MRNQTRAPRNRSEIIQCVKATGSHFFDSDTMRAFNSKVYDDVYPTKFGTFFLTSERDKPWHCFSTSRTEPGAWNSRRRYTVRFVAARRTFATRREYRYTYTRGQLIDISADDFGAFATLNAARRHARQEQARLAGLLIKDSPALFDMTPAQS